MAGGDHVHPPSPGRRQRPPRARRGVIPDGEGQTARRADAGSHRSPGGTALPSGPRRRGTEPDRHDVPPWGGWALCARRPTTARGISGPGGAPRGGRGPLGASGGRTGVRRSCGDGPCPAGCLGGRGAGRQGDRPARGCRRGAGSASLAGPGQLRAHVRVERRGPLGRSHGARRRGARSDTRLTAGAEAHVQTAACRKRPGARPGSQASPAGRRPSPRRGQPLPPSHRASPAAGGL